MLRTRMSTCHFNMSGCAKQGMLAKMQIASSDESAPGELGTALTQPVLMKHVICYKEV